MYIKLREKKAFTLVEIMIVVAIIGLLVAIAVPNFIKARNTARQNLCYNNMRLIGHGAEQYIIDNNLAESTVVTNAQAAEYVKGGLLGAAFTCPAGAGAYVIANPGTSPTVTCGSAAAHGTYTVSTGLIT